MSDDRPECGTPAARQDALRILFGETGFPDCFSHTLGDECAACREIREQGPHLARPTNLTQRALGLLAFEDELIARAVNTEVIPTLGTPGRRRARQGRLKLIDAIMRKSA